MTQRPKAAIIAVGSELLALGRGDTNSPFIAALLGQYGVEVASTTVVSDEWDDLVSVLRYVLSRVDLVVCTGGLGPTDDDRTRDAVAAVLGVTMREDPGVIAHIQQRFLARKLAMPGNNRRQAQVPVGATVVPNARGTAPGLWIPANGKAVALLPGPPREMQPMAEHVVTHHVAALWGGFRTAHRAVVVAGRSESWVDEQLHPVYGPWRDETPPVRTTVLASLGTVELHLSTVGTDADASASRLQAAVDALSERMGTDVVSTDGRGLVGRTGDLLRSRGWRLGIAESCTGGLVTSRLTDVGGSSGYLDRGVVCYSNASKETMLGVPATLFEDHGAVSDPVARAMAEGMCQRHRVDVALAITGIAGPDGGTPVKPVGLVWMAVAGPAGTRSRLAQFTGDRLTIKAMAASAAIDYLRRYVQAASASE